MSRAARPAIFATTPSPMRVEPCSVVSATPATLGRVAVVVVGRWASMVAARAPWVSAAARSLVVGSPRRPLDWLSALILIPPFRCSVDNFTLAALTSSMGQNG
jgi:hypothetical protein